MSVSQSFVLSCLSVLYILLNLLCYCCYVKMPSVKLYDLKDIEAQKGIKYVHLNVRSLLRHRDELQVDLFDGHFDIIALSETWLHASISSTLVEYPGYHLVRLDRDIRNPKGGFKAGGGLCLYVRDGLDVSIPIDGLITNSDIELIHVKVSRQNL